MRPDLPDLPSLLEEFNPQCSAWSQLASPQGLQMEQQCQLRLYDLGSHQVPSFDVVFVASQDDTLSRSSQPLDIEVASARQEGEDQLRDIKPPLRISGGIPLWVAVVGVVVAIVLVGLFCYWLWRRRHRASTPVEVESKPIDFAAEFTRIAGLGLLDRGEFKIYYSLLSENLRRFLELSLEIEAMEQTTSELAVAMRGVEIENRLAQQIVEYLGVADLVKFARFHPDIDTARRAPEAGLTLLRDVEDLVASQARAAEDHAEHPV
tara:strand:+ start:57 stop:848 length:792 start_codon:yes stop_codon:yes gene_type:complete